MPLLAGKYRVIAPDYPGFGQSDAPTQPSSSTASAATPTWWMRSSVRSAPGALCRVRHGLSARRSGYRLAPKHPEGVSALIRPERQRLPRGAEGVLGPIKRLLGERIGEGPGGPVGAWSSSRRPSSHTPTARPRLSPSRTTGTLVGRSRSAGQQEHPARSALSLRTNVPLYPPIPAVLPRPKPPTLIVSGKNDKVFPQAGAHPTHRSARRRVPYPRYRPLRPGGPLDRDGAAPPRCGRSSAKMKRS